MKMKSMLDNYLAHVKDKKDYYFKKDEYIFRFYEGQYVLLLDLMLKIKEKVR
jgi:hypothetical protein